MEFVFSEVLRKTALSFSLHLEWVDHPGPADHLDQACLVSPGGFYHGIKVKCVSGVVGGADRPPGSGEGHSVRRQIPSKSRSPTGEPKC